MPRADSAARPVFPLVIATAFGAGYAPVAPGTFGSLVGLVLWFAMPVSIGAQAMAILALFLVGSWAGTVAERHCHATDPGIVVIDEVMGMMMTMFMNPLGWTSAILGFLLFRGFDIIKPFPARRLERLHGGVGIMADDAMAAIYANLSLRLILSVIG